MRKQNQPIERLEPRTLLAVSLVKDVNALQAPYAGTTYIANAGSTVYLTQEDTTSGSELWKSDGTGGGTTLVKDIRAGALSSAPSQLTMVGANLFFVANDGASGAELWKSNGTAAGTVLVKDINPGGGSSNATALVNVNGTLFFAANDGTNGTELWKSDGTTAGTVLVKDIASVAGASASPQRMINNNGTLFFVANDGSTGNELWKSDGTSGGTVQVRDIEPGSSGANPAYLTSFNGSVYFQASPFSTGSEVWKSDGTSAGTVVVKDISPGSSPSLPQFLTVSGSFLYFSCNVSSTLGLYRTDGTSAGTILLSPTGSNSYQADVGGTFYYANGSTLYKSTGASVTTVRTGLSGLSGLAGIGSTLYFSCDDGIGNGTELWKSQGTSGTTSMVKDIYPGTASGSALGITPIGVAGQFVFIAFDSNGGALFKSDGTAANTGIVKDIFTGTDNGTPRSLTEYNGSLYFSAGDGVSGTDFEGELYRTNGTAAGTSLVVDLASGIKGSFPTNLKVFNNRLYFRAGTPALGYEIYSTDGTAAGTSMLLDINAGAGSSNPSDFQYLTTSGNYLYFAANQPSTGEELWRTDGTAGGTIILPEAVAGSTGGSPSYMTDVNGTLYYVANGALWKSNGTAGTTQPVPVSLTSIYGLTSMNGLLYFAAAGTGSNGVRLYRSDGTAAGTVPVKVSAAPNPENLVNVNGTLYFTSTGNGTELWKSDGTDAGTVQVKDINPTGSSSPAEIVNVNGVAYFRASDGVNGAELWRSDGTTVGTYMVKNIGAGATAGTVRSLAAANGFLYFTADDGVNGEEIWRSDGTTAGTAMLADLYTGSLGGTTAFGFTAYSGAVYAAGRDVAAGYELRKIDAPQFASLAGTILTITGTANDDTIHLSSAGGTLTVAFNGLTQTFSASSVSSIVVNAGLADDALDLDTSLGSTTVTFNGGGGADTYRVNAGAFTINADLGAAAGESMTLVVGAGASATLASSQHLASVSVAGTLTLGAAGNRLLVTRAFTIGAAGKLDLRDNSMIVDYASATVLPSVQASINAARANGAWTGNGLTSTNAAIANPRNRTLGAMEATDYKSVYGPSATFAGEAIDSSAVLVKFTYYGDTDFNGLVNFDDYSRTDAGFNQARSGWLNGDFDGNGVVNFDDYSLIDLAFNTQSPARPAGSPAALPKRGEGAQSH